MIKYKKEEKMNSKIFIKRNWDLLLVYFIPVIWILNFFRIRNYFFTSAAAGIGMSILYLVILTIFLMIIVFVRTYKSNLNKKRLFWLIPLICAILYALVLILLNFDIIDLPY